MSDYVDRIRNAANVVQLVEEMTKLTPSGNRLKGLCPFHEDGEASFTVYPDQGSWHCFGCGRGGSAFDLIMQSKGLDFTEAARWLAERYNIPVPQMTEEDRAKVQQLHDIEQSLEGYVEKAHERLLQSKEALGYLHKRGVTDETIERLKLGLGFGLKKIKDNPKAEQCGLLARTKTGDIWQPMDGRLIFPVRRNGKVIQLCGRTLKDEDKVKYLNLPGLDVYPYNAHVLRHPKAILVEGILDAILLEQSGFDAVGTLSGQFKPEWFKLIGKETELVLAYDNDSNGAGQTATAKVGELLFSRSHHVYAGLLPPSTDPASLVLDEGAGAFQKVLDEAKPYVEYLIDSLPPTLDAYALEKALKGIYAKIATLSPATHDRYVGKLADRLSLTRAGIRDGLKAHVKESKKRDEPTASEGTDEILRREVNPIKFIPAQDVIGNTLYYTIYMQVQSKEFVPFIITSNRECFRFTKDAMTERDFRVEPSQKPFDTNRWSIGLTDSYNVYDYLDGKTHVDPKELYTKIRWYFKRFLRLPDPFYYDFLTLWCIGTYHFRLHDAFGYIFLNAIKGSGKTQALTILMWLAFNASQADAITEAGLKRLVNANAATLLNDEAEKLCKKFEDDQSAIFEIWNGGYKKTGQAIMVNKDTMDVECFTTFSPKALANIRGLDATLEDRCITLYFEKDIGKIPQLIEGEQAGRVSDIRNMLYCFSLEYIEQLSEAKKEVKRPDGLSGREWELWQGVITLAHFLDSLGIVEPEEFSLRDGTAKTLAGLEDRMVTMALERRNYRQALEAEMNPHVRILQIVWDFMQENPDSEHWYPAAPMIKLIREETGREKYSPEAFSHFVFENAHLAKDRSKDRVKRRSPGSSPRWHYRLQPEVVVDQARRMFGIELLPKDPSQNDDGGGIFDE
jgi:DNA primase